MTEVANPPETKLLWTRRKRRKISIKTFHSSNWSLSQTSIILVYSASRIMKVWGLNTFIGFRGRGSEYGTSFTYTGQQNTEIYRSDATFELASTTLQWSKNLRAIVRKPFWLFFFFCNLFMTTHFTHKSFPRGHRSSHSNQETGCGFPDVEIQFEAGFMRKPLKIS